MLTVDCVVMLDHLPCEDILPFLEYYVASLLHSIYYKEYVSVPSLLVALQYYSSSWNTYLMFIFLEPVLSLCAKTITSILYCMNKLNLLNWYILDIYIYIAQFFKADSGMYMYIICRCSSQFNNAPISSIL